MINDLEFPEADGLLRHAVPMARRIAALKQLAADRGIPTIYVNDNFGHWQSDFRSQVEHCLRDAVRGEAVAKLVAPGQEDYFVLKPMHSGFYGTVLELLLKHLKVERLIVCGIATNMCVSFTASDAYMRGYALWIPRDCVAANTKSLSDTALRQMRSTLKAKTAPVTAASLDAWASTRAATVKHHQLIRDG